jgi:hypothetical protein
MEALEKDFEDLLDSEEDVLIESDRDIEDLTEEEVAEFTSILDDSLELLDEEHIDLIIDLDEESEEEDWEIVYEMIEALGSWKPKTKADATKDKKKRTKWLRSAAGKLSLKKAARRAKKVASGAIKVVQTAATRLAAKRRARSLAKTQSFDPTEWADVDAEDLGEDLDVEILDAIGDVYAEYMAEQDEELTDEQIDTMLDDEEFLDEAKIKKVISMIKRLGAGGAKKAAKAAAKYYKKNKKKLAKKAKKRAKLGKKPKYTIKRAHFDPYIDSDGQEVQLSSYDATEDVTALVGDTELSEDFKTKASTIFEAAVSRQVNVHVDHLKETYEDQLTEALDETSDEMITKIDSYLDYVASNWLDQNQMEVDSGARTEINESFIVEMKKVFDSHYIDVPDAKVDVVNDLSDRLGELESKLDDEITANVALKQEITEHRKNATIQSLSAGLTDTDLEKLKELSQSVEYDGDEEEFSSKLQVIKEQYFPTTNGKVQKVVEEDTEESFEQTSGVMDMYTSALSRTVKTQEL